MIKKIVPAVILLLSTVTTNAQFIGIGGNINHLSNGILGSYIIQSQNQKWEYSVGLRILLNKLDLSAPSQQFVFYQQGVAHTFWENFSFNFTVSRKIISFNKFSVNAMANAHIAFQSIYNKSQTYDIANDSFYTATSYYKASPSFEVTIGPEIQYQFSSKIGAYLRAGWGFIYLDHNHKGKVLETNEDAYLYLTGSSFLYKKRGALEMVGFDGLPMMALGVKYTLPSK